MYGLKMFSLNYLCVLRPNLKNFKGAWGGHGLLNRGFSHYKSIWKFQQGQSPWQVQEEERACTTLREFPFFTGKGKTMTSMQKEMCEIRDKVHKGWDFWHSQYILNLFSLTGKSWTGRAVSWSMCTEITFLCLLVDFLTKNVCMWEDHIK